MLCEFEQITDRVDGLADFKCKVCGRIVRNVKSKSADKIVASCSPDSEPRKPLTLLDMAANATRAAARFAAGGAKTTTSAMRAERLATCRKCPAFDAALTRCKDCGCFLQVKTWMPAEKCPQGKWAS